VNNEKKCTPDCRPVTNPCDSGGRPKEIVSPPAFVNEEQDLFPPVDCDTGHVLQLRPHSGRPAGKGKPKDRDEIEKYEQMIEELKEMRLEARQLTKSGHPGVRAEALRHLANAEDDLRWLRAQLSKERGDD
jgi:hypothetical protein